ncbi:hypothetical protein LTS15_008818 [Exophiala xenobiotica]|nr:hypothetical protein LTS15_008818 [Exophiala xenobiotica]
MMYISPPTSSYPSRPPTELVSSFCLMSGGIVFMASTKDIVLWMEAENLMATFLFTVTSGFPAFIMAYEILVLSLKGWATRHVLRILTLLSNTAKSPVKRDLSHGAGGHPYIGTGFTSFWLRCQDQDMGK